MTGCAEAPVLPAAPDLASGPRSRLIHVVSNGWHTALVLPRRPVAASGLLPEAADFPEAGFLEIGWGDRTYFPHPEPGIGMALRAALTPTEAILHIVGKSRPPQRAYPEAEVHPIWLTDGGFRRMLAAIGAYVERDGQRAQPAIRDHPTLSGSFYHARGTFHLFNTCNSWTADILRAAGVDIGPAVAVTAGDLMARLPETENGGS